MFPEQLKKILQLIKQTGDRVIVFDPNTPDDSYVILDLDRYSGMVSKEEKPKTKEEVLKELPHDFVEETLKSEKLTEDDLTDKINREISMWKNRDNSAFLAEENKPKKAWQIPSQVKNNAQNVE